MNNFSGSYQRIYIDSKTSALFQPMIQLCINDTESCLLCALCRTFTFQFRFKLLFEMNHQIGLLLCVVALTSSCDVEYLANGDFEEPFDGDDWSCVQCTLEQDSSDANTGSYSGRVTDR